MAETIKTFDVTEVDKKGRDDRIAKMAAGIAELIIRSGKNSKEAKN